MIFIRYIDIYDIFYDENGKSYEKILVPNSTMPIYIDKNNISSIYPNYTSEGKLYKNVSILVDNSDKKYKVVGNYKEILNKIYGSKTVGFSNGKKPEDSNN